MKSVLMVPTTRASCSHLDEGQSVAVIFGARAGFLATHTARADRAVSICSALGPQRPSLRRWIHGSLVLNQLIIPLRHSGLVAGAFLTEPSPWSLLHFEITLCLLPFLPSHFQGTCSWVGYTRRSQEAYGILGNKTKPEANSDEEVNSKNTEGFQARTVTLIVAWDP